MNWILNSWNSIMEWLQSAWVIVLELIGSFKITDALDIIVVSFIIYSAIKLVRETRAEQLRCV